MDLRKAAQDKAAADRWQRLLDHQELVFRICLGMCRNSADADDMAQETNALGTDLNS